jgi:hypothetical protein
MRRSQSLLFFLILLFLPTYFHAQNWSGILDPSRAIDWSSTYAPGVTGGIPNVTNQCGSTISAYNGAATMINNAIAGTGAGYTGCSKPYVIVLGTGTFILTSGINFTGQSQVVLRGQGADQTKIIFTGNTPCRGIYAVVCISSTTNPVVPNPSNTANWTASYSRGATTIALDNVSGLGVNSILILDQCDTGLSGASCATGTVADNGNLFICATITVCSGQGGHAYTRSNRAQQQLVRVTGISGNNVSIKPPIIMPNWASGSSPGAFWAGTTPVHGDGLEDLSIDETADASTHGITMLYVYDCWVKGIRSIQPDQSHVAWYQTITSTIRDSYFYGSQTSSSQSYGVENTEGSDNLYENNIGQHTAGPVTIGGPDEGNVYAYSYSLDDWFTTPTGWMIPSNIAHEGGIAMDLMEGNSGLGMEGDIIHGTHDFMTGFRNLWQGDVCACPAKSGNSAPMNFWAFDRYVNAVGNVIGQPGGYYTSYESDLSGNATAIYSLGAAAGQNGAPSDAFVKTSLLRWGNYDTVTGTSRFVSSEVPSGLAKFANPVPANNNLPASFYLNSKPSWFGATPWPPVGPDVTGGNISGMGGHANAIPAQVCFNNSPIDSSYPVSSGKPVILFNANNCYAGAQQVSPPSGLTAVVN